jgi:diketogulonate reductase-like aldo/keto reductase
VTNQHPHLLTRCSHPRTPVSLEGTAGSHGGLPRLLYGTAWKKDDTARLVQQAITLGFRAIDTACQPKHYHEAGVGQGIAAGLVATGLTRADLFIQTKFTALPGQDPANLPYSAEASLPEQVAQSFAASCRNLRTTYLDSLILHSPLPDREQTLMVWRAMEQLAACGATRRIGLSNCYDLDAFVALYEAAVIKPWAVQNRFQAKTDYDRPLRAFCHQHGIVYQSFWTLTANPQVLAHPHLQALATRLQRSPAQVFFRYLTQLGVLPLTGTCSAAHMQEDLAIFEFELDAAACNAVGRLLV